MIKIAHRGNLYGKNPSRENDPIYIMDAVDKGYHVEVDVRSYKNNLYFGHDEPTYRVNWNILTLPEVICHAKDHKALEMLRADPRIHCFWHQDDDYTITSEGWLWVYPKKDLIQDSVCVLPELGFSGDILDCKAVCSDHAGELYKYLHD